MNDSHNNPNRLSNKLLGFVLRFGHQSSQSAPVASRKLAPIDRLAMEKFASAFIQLHSFARHTKKTNYSYIFFSFQLKDSNTQSSDLYTLSTNSGSENSQNHSKTSSSDNLHASPALRSSNNQSRLSGTPRHSADRNASQKFISEGSVSPHGHSTYSVNTADVYGDNQTVINLGTAKQIIIWHGKVAEALPTFSVQI